MSAIIQVCRSGNSEVVSAHVGARLSEALPFHNTIDMPCGAKGTCLRCVVRVTGMLSPPTAVEKARFSKEELAQGWRLACQAAILGDIQVFLEPPAMLEQILTSGTAIGQDGTPLYQEWGLAVDLGTTTLCAQLYGKSGLVGTVAMKNPQAAFGADVISRIEKALSGQREALARCVQEGIRRLIADLAQQQGLFPTDIDAAVITGNTTMLHLLTGHSPEAISHAPFAADRLFGELLPCGAVGLPLMEDSQVYLPRCISSFVGGDITTAILASGICQREETGLLVDIGTNGEIVLWHKGSLFCCSTAAGPAFEGGGIEKGVYGIAGAVDKVWLEGKSVRFSTIGGRPAVGICGSGIVDALAVMLQTGVVDETGALQCTDERFPLGSVYITSRDVRVVQLAKGSIRAGVETLLHIAGVSKHQVDRLYLAGGFGNHLHLKHAAAIGLIPPELLTRTSVIGNAALAGASVLLRNCDLIERSHTLAVHAETVALDANPIFAEYYMEYMLF